MAPGCAHHMIAGRETLDFRRNVTAGTSTGTPSIRTGGNWIENTRGLSGTATSMTYTELVASRVLAMG